MTKAPLDFEGRFRRSTLRCGGAVCRFLGRLRRLAESFTEGAKLGDLRLAELVIPVLEVLDRLVEPFLLVLRCGTNDSAADNVLKHLVARLIERRLWLYLSTALTVSLIGHECWVCVGWEKAEK